MGKKRVLVGKLNFSACRYHQQRGVKPFISLDELGDFRIFLKRGCDWGGISDWSKPNHEFGSVLYPASAGRELHLAFDFDVLRRGGKIRQPQKTQNGQALSE